MPVIITITSEPTTSISGQQYDYSSEDRILKNIHKDEYEVFYSGQNQGKADHELLESLEASDDFHVYYRGTINKPFTYLGVAAMSNVVQYRTVPRKANSDPSERLQIHLVITNAVNETLQDDGLFSGPGKYKKAVLHHRNFPMNLNTNVGFYKI